MKNISVFNRVGAGTFVWLLTSRYLSSKILKVLRTSQFASPGTITWVLLEIWFEPQRKSSHDDAYDITRENLITLTQLESVKQDIPFVDLPLFNVGEVPNVKIIL
ncbi:uncharacterized protein LOC124612380 [Schistocerca americana]|uniref:uncharacterized protein LOC124612380 n=1 Tax=Schistocerca americana TaxID=7009 RepID=UPI001F4FE239|nr:uncharacterized protein LOC124612380 [Schistocerca americana]